MVYHSFVSVILVPHENSIARGAQYSQLGNGLMRGLLCLAWYWPCQPRYSAPLRLAPK